MSEAKKNTLIDRVWRGLSGAARGDKLRDRTAALYDQLLTLSSPGDRAAFPKSVQTKHDSIVSNGATILKNGSDADVAILLDECLDVAGAVVLDLWADDE